MSKIIYSKYSNERNKKFQIRTSILQNDDGKKIVKKLAIVDESKKHIDDIFENFERLKDNYYLDERVKINLCNKTEDGLEFEYLEGMTLDKIIDDFMENNEYDKSIEIIKDFRNVIFNVSTTCGFNITEDFIKVFGNVDFNSDTKATLLSNIDSSFNNLVINDAWNIIDYEWVYKFPIPIRYILYRALNIYITTSVYGSKLKDLNIYDILGYSELELSKYEFMEYNFGRYIAGESISLQNLYEDIKTKKYKLEELLISNDFNKRMQIFYDEGNGFSEENSYYIDLEMKNKITIPLEKDIKSIRIDPASVNCIILINKLDVVFANETIDIKNNLITNADEKKQDLYNFLSSDPQIYIDLGNRFQKGYINFEYEIKKLDFDTYDIYLEVRNLMLNNQNKLINLNKELEERNMQLDILGKEINQINDRLENTLNELDNAKNKIYILEKRKIKNILRNMKKRISK
ncbi:hypothetical protein BGV19_05630 [Clostridioides difficile]|uniref:hypothetical protein n=1 Tax=Clostridioides difficile TaxID=1496 RepID=UPI000BB172EF|nr:hypothetical protein [Clostridioides difficile]PBH14860.1 hypothetical protein BGV19_05630 [Clostridioides difficile]